MAAQAKEMTLERALERAKEMLDKESPYKAYGYLEMAVETYLKGGIKKR